MTADKTIDHDPDYWTDKLRYFSNTLEQTVTHNAKTLTLQELQRPLYPEVMEAAMELLYESPLEFRETISPRVSGQLYDVMKVEAERRLDLLAKASEAKIPEADAIALSAMVKKLLGPNFSKFRYGTDFLSAARLKKMVEDARLPTEAEMAQAIAVVAVVAPASQTLDHALTVQQEVAKKFEDPSEQTGLKNYLAQHIKHLQSVQQTPEAWEERLANNKDLVKRLFSALYPSMGGFPIEPTKTMGLLYEDLLQDMARTTVATMESLNKNLNKDLTLTDDNKRIIATRIATLAKAIGSNPHSTEEEKVQAATTGKAVYSLTTKARNGKGTASTKEVLSR